MKKQIIVRTLQFLFVAALFPAALRAAPVGGAVPKLDGLFYETAAVRTTLPNDLLAKAQKNRHSEVKMPDGRVVKISIEREGQNLELKFSAKPDADILKWGVALDADADEYFTGLMERVVDGPQQDSWATNITAAMNLRGETVDMIVKPTMSVYAPFYLSSRGYAVFVQGNWPGRFDFCASDPTPGENRI